MKLLTQHLYVLLILLLPLTACTTKSVNKAALTTLNEQLVCVDLANNTQQFCSLVSPHSSFPSDDINVYFIDTKKKTSSLVITQSDFGSMYADVKLLNDDKYLIYGTAEEGHLVYAIYLVENLIAQGTLAEPIFIIGEYGIIDILAINSRGKLLYKIDFHMKRPSLTCIKNSPPEQCYIEVTME